MRPNKFILIYWLIVTIFQFSSEAKSQQVLISQSLPYWDFSRDSEERKCSNLIDAESESYHNEIREFYDLDSTNWTEYLANQPQDCYERFLYRRNIVFRFIRTNDRVWRKFKNE